MTEQEPKKEVVNKLLEEEASKSVITKIPKDMTAMSDQDLLTSMLSIYSPSGEEHAMIAYVTQFLRDAEIDYEIDTAGNIYFSNHVKGEQRILLNAHMDTVGSAAPDIIIEKQKIGTVVRSTNEQVIGGDDKCGVFAVLRLMTNKAIETPLSALLTVAEESGCNGVRHAMDYHSDKFTDIVFNITIDRNGNTDIITQNCDYQLCSDAMEKMLGEWGKEHGLKTTSGSISDVSEIVSTLNINGINLFAGYYNAHSGKEYIVMEHLYRSMVFIQRILPKLHGHFIAHPDQLTYNPTRAVSKWSYGGHYGGYGLGAYEYYGGVRYYKANDGISWKKDDKKDEDSNAFLDGMELFCDALEHIEQQEGQYTALERMVDDDEIRLSKSGKSIVIPDAFVNYFVEMDIIEDHMPVGQNGYDGVIAMEDIKAYLERWSLSDDEDDWGVGSD